MAKDPEIAALYRLIDERDRQYSAAFKAAETAVNAALAAQQQAVKDAFLASEKAIVKAEDAQRDYNVRSNEFRGQLDDQAKTLMPRSESAALFHAIDEKLGLMQSATDLKIENLRKDIASLRESRSEGTGRASQQAVYISMAIAGVGFVIGLLSIGVSIAVRVFS